VTVEGHAAFRVHGDTSDEIRLARAKKTAREASMSQVLSPTIAAS
jgi:hypothetical protein